MVRKPQGRVVRIGPNVVRPMFFLLALWLVPLTAALVSRRVAPSHLWRNTGFAFGLIVAPASLGLYGLYYVGPLAAVFGMLGLVLSLIHGPPGYNLAITLGLISSQTTVTGAANVPVEFLNALVWSVVYGVVGWLIDGWRARKRVAKPYAV